MMSAVNDIDHSRTLHELFASEWDWQMREDPVWASRLGDRRWNDRWPELGVDASARRQDHYADVLARLKSIDRERLSPADRLNYDLFARDYRVKLEEHRHRWYLVPLDQMNGVQTSHELTVALRFDTREDDEQWIERLRRFPAYVDGAIALLGEGLRSRHVLPRVIVERVIGQIDRQVDTRPSESPYLPASLARHDDGSLGRLRDAATREIESAVNPSLSRLGTFLRDDYLPGSFERVGIWQMPEGERIYDFFVRKYTTTGLSAREVHEIGIEEVGRIGDAMQGVLHAVAFSGSMQEFFEFLRNDARFYCATPAELLTEYRAVSKRIDPTLVKLFRTLPRTPYGVEPVPEITAPDTTTAYYAEPAADGSRAGTYYVNLYKPDTRPKYEMMALALHEAVPGHHLQIALAMEQGELPSFRRYSGATAFIEGWALYAEYLGNELGLYDDPYSRVGQLTYEMWRAVRLVVDTGIHAFRWSRQQAIDYFMRHAARPAADIVNEIDRYAAWPGQALAYKIGELKIKELRRRASDALGDRFDVGAFHDAVLLNGAVPLDVLEGIVADYITASSAPGSPPRRSEP